MSNSKIVKMLKFTDGNFITLKKIALDESTPAEIRITAILAINKKFEKSPMQAVYPEVESNNVNIKTDSKIE
jgi:hypothetical protein